MITRQMLLAPKDPKVTKVRVEAWGDDAHLRVISGKEREKYSRTVFQKQKANDPTGIMTLLLCMSLCDDKGLRLLDDNDAGLLNEQPTDVLEFLFHEAQKWNGLIAESVEDERKN